MSILSPRPLCSTFSDAALPQAKGSKPLLVSQNVAGALPSDGLSGSEIRRESRRRQRGTATRLGGDTRAPAGRCQDRESANRALRRHPKRSV